MNNTEEELIKEAKRRGFIEGALCIHLTGQNTARYIVASSYRFYKNVRGLTLYAGVDKRGEPVCIYQNGEWSEILEHSKKHKEETPEPANYDWVKDVKIGDELVCKSNFSTSINDRNYGGAGYEPRLKFTVRSVDSFKHPYGGTVIWTGSQGVFAKAIIPPDKKSRLSGVIYKKMSIANLDKLPHNMDAIDAMAYAFKNSKEYEQIINNKQSKEDGKSKQEFVGRSIKVQRSSIKVSRGTRQTGVGVALRRPTRTIGGRHKGNVSKSC